jgi:hypothetical protein
MDVVELVAAAAPSAILGAIAGGLVAEVRGRRAEAREERRRARDRAREWDLKRIADTRAQFGLNIRSLIAHARGEAEGEAALDREIDCHPFPDNDIRIFGAHGQSLMTDLYRPPSTVATAMRPTTRPGCWRIASGAYARRSGTALNAASRWISSRSPSRASPTTSGAGSSDAPSLEHDPRFGLAVLRVDVGLPLPGGLAPRTPTMTTSCCREPEQLTAMAR